MNQHYGKTALVLIELQNDFLAKDGALNKAVSAVLESNDVVSNINETIDGARKLGLTIVHVPIAFSDDYVEVGDDPHGILDIVKNAGAFRKGSWGAEFYEGIDIQEHDIVIEAKSGICAFTGTNLDLILRHHGITSIALAGLLTNVCIESTMRTAYNLGYQIHTLTDCMATVSHAHQQAAIEHNFSFFSQPTDHRAFLSQIAVSRAE
jgi:ureidoacrylate peracid hydrolase